MKAGNFLVSSTKFAVKHWKITIILILLLPYIISGLCDLALGTHLITKGVDMGKLRFNEASNSVTVYGYTYPRMYTLLPILTTWGNTWGNNASKCEPKFTEKADQMFQEWLANNSSKYKLVSANTSSGEKEDSFGRRIKKANRRQQITREYTLEKKPEG